MSIDGRRLPLLLAFVGAVASSSPARAQWPPDSLRNVKVLPAGISIRSLVDTMKGFTRALGVRCTYCHGGGPTMPLDSIDFPSDSLAPKRKAREMLRMVQTINGELLARVPDRRQPPIVVTCATCHHGIAQPRPLQQVLLTAYDAGGADSADALYRALRKRYYGSAAYDFGEVPLVDVAEALQRRDRLADALRLYKLNIEFSPTSFFALRQAAEAQLTAGDTATAVAYYEQALVLSPSDGLAKARLDVLRKKP